MLLTKEAILAAAVSKTVDVNVPEWGGTVRLRMISGADRDAIFRDGKRVGDSLDMADHRARLVSASAITEAGEPMFTLEEAAALDASSAAGLLRLHNAAQRLNGLLPDDVAEAEKN